MVRMQRVGPERIVGDDHVRAMRANHPGDPLPQVEIRNQRAVGLAQ
jgi:hypothetical protein